MRYGYYTNGFRFNSHLADFRFVFFLYFFSGLLVRVTVGLGQVFQGVLGTLSRSLELKIGPLESEKLSHYKSILGT